MACLPRRRDETGTWIGLNLTWYGFFNACAYVFGVTLLLVMLATVNIPVGSSAAVILTILVICVPASRLLAWLIDGKRYNFTIGGATFVGVLVAPLAITLMPSLIEMPQRPIKTWLAAIVIAYAFGEGVGRLACVSYGCCYGRSLEDSPTWIQRLFGRRHFRFVGETKKASYEGQLMDVPLVPIQAITCVVLSMIGVVGLTLFLHGFDAAALITVAVTSQMWRFGSELLRKDNRGPGRISVYQLMTPITIAILLVIAFQPSSTPSVPRQIGSGLEVLWQPEVILGLQVLWIGIFVFTGRSQMTGSKLALHVHHEHV
ncbi:prolipoprotein diacylglyceryl transferase family protein [Thalassoroseus pseudoceratinae]|uniref:prolipoprotein diacylglyceryl transferase family protein n=1 Tax=Thalassoroseus pseudoceratinae TaxID=2713176 RepID=UPI001422F54D|nr:prolipoprotein diacylglyceryl transferase family protein [Thalassoroseus pseudoceratinae]